jgi:hypothetical protein
MRFRQVGLASGLLMLGTLCLPLLLASLVATGRFTLLAGLVGGSLAGVVIYMSSGLFLSDWEAVPGTMKEKSPKLIGAKFIGVLLYSEVLVFLGYAVNYLGGG